MVRGAAVRDQPGLWLLVSLSWTGAAAVSITASSSGGRAFVRGGLCGFLRYAGARHGSLLFFDTLGDLGDLLAAQVRLCQPGVHHARKATVTSVSASVPILVNASKTKIKTTKL